MAEAEEHYTTLAERIAALNKQKNFTSPPPASTPANKRPPHPSVPSPTNRPVSRAQSQSTPTVNGVSRENDSPAAPAGRPSSNRGGPPPLPRRTSTQDAHRNTLTLPHALPSRGPAPPLPTRRDSGQASPALPPRRPSTQSLAVRRHSNESDRSYNSTISSLSLSHTLSPATSAGSTNARSIRKLPPALDQAKLPPLPPTRRELDARAREEAQEEAAAAAAAQEIVKPPLLPARSAPVVLRAEPPRPSLPPRLPTRPARSPGTREEEEPAPALPRRLPPRPERFGRSAPEPNLNGGRTADAPAPDVGVPPPVPLASRPRVAALNGTSSPDPPTQTPSCLVCRDFSKPDNLAAQYPSHTVPRQDPIGYLAQVLCGPFSSPTDKARTIFTWCHHNIAYDVPGLLAGCPARGSASDTIFSGKAVCEGYARVFEAVAQRAGLECVFVHGHGKGFGFKVLKSGETPPPRNATGHAWNVVRIDNGEWKLIDACWGAGHRGNGEYVKQFNPRMFTMSNEHFGVRHYPENDRYQLRNDGRTIGWEEYIVGPARGEQAQWFSNAAQEGISQYGSSPQEKYISVGSGEIVRFQFSKLCKHWDGERNGPGQPMLLMMKIHGVDGRKEDLVPLDHDGFWWWVDIHSRDLGCPGQTISLYGLATLDGQDARGVSKSDYLSKKGRCGWSGVGIAAWELV